MWTFRLPDRDQYPGRGEQRDLAEQTDADVQRVHNELHEDVQEVFTREELLDILSRQIMFGTESPWIRGYNTAILDLANLLLPRS